MMFGVRISSSTGCSTWLPETGQPPRKLTHTQIQVATLPCKSYSRRRNIDLAGRAESFHQLDCGGFSGTLWNGIGSHLLPIVGCRLDSRQDVGHGADRIVPPGLTVVVGCLQRIRIATASPFRVLVFASH